MTKTIQTLLIIILSVCCGSPQEPHESQQPVQNSDDLQAQTTAQNESATEAEYDDIQPPSPVTGAFLSCQTLEHYTYCRVQESFSNQRKIDQAIAWNVSDQEEDQQIEYLDDESQWHIRIEHSDDIAIRATLPSNEELSYFHDIKSSTDEDTSCPPYTVSYQEHCLRSSGRQSSHQRNLIFSNMQLHNQSNQSFKSYLPYPMIYSDSSLRVDVTIDWEQITIPSQKVPHDTKFIVFLMRQNTLGHWIKRSYLCFSPDLMVKTGQLNGTFEVPDEYSVYYLSQPLLTDQTCSNAILEKDFQHIEVFGAILPE